MSKVTRRGKSPARSQLKRVDLGDVSDARFAGSEEVMSHQTKRVEGFVEYLKANVDSSVTVGVPFTRYLSTVVPVTMKNGFSNFDATLVKIKERYPSVKFNINRNGYEGTFILPFVDIFGSRSWNSIFLRVCLVLLWCLLAYMFW